MKRQKYIQRTNHTRLYLLLLVALLAAILSQNIDRVSNIDISYIFRHHSYQTVPYTAPKKKQYTAEETYPPSSAQLPEKLISPIIIWPTTTKLTIQEKLFLQESNPFGIIFKNNNLQNDKKNLINLINEVKTLLKRDDIFFIADLEIGTNFNGILKVRNVSRAYKFGLKTKQDLEGTKKEIYESGVELGRELHKIGFNMVLAPVVDVQEMGLETKNFDKENWNGLARWRTLSDDPQIVTILAEEFTRGIQEQKIFVTYKHFPGLGSSNVDSHGKMPTIHKTLEELYKRELLPYLELDKKNVNFVMIGHAMLPALDKNSVSTFSKDTINFLKYKLGFDGFVISDALNMGALSGNMTERCEKAYNAGIDILLPFFGNISNEEKMKCINAPGSEKMREFNTKFIQYKKIFFTE